MKRFLRYMLYRELYRHLRRASRSGGGRSVEPGKAAEEGVPVPEMSPDEGTTIESPDQLRAVLQRMDEAAFERLVADLWERMGSQTEVSSGGADKGVDVIATTAVPYDETTLIQAKRYGPDTTVGSPEVQQYASLKNQYDGVDTVAIVTTNDFSGQAREIAKDLNVKLVDGDDLVDLLADVDAVDLVAEHVSFVTVTEEESRSEVPETRVSPDIENTSETRWYRLTQAGIAGWLILLFGVEILPAALWSSLSLVIWPLLPIALYMDASRLADDAGWPRYLWGYVIGTVVPFLAVIPGAVYLWRRRRVTGE